eukprot:m.653977 g.653977  ORF g.653977 m.653977 type:complete len:143 (-) comp58408_c1_seq22:281-709(-)
MLKQAQEALGDPLEEQAVSVPVLPQQVQPAWLHGNCLYSRSSGSLPFSHHAIWEKIAPYFIYSLTFSFSLTQLLHLDLHHPKHAHVVPRRLTHRHRMRPFRLNGERRDAMSKESLPAETSDKLPADLQAAVTMGVPIVPKKS